MRFPGDVPCQAGVNDSELSSLTSAYLIPGR